MITLIGTSTESWEKAATVAVETAAKKLKDLRIAEVDELVECIDQVDASFIIVTNEVGLGLVPANRLGRLYRDLLGRANQMLAKRADDIYLMVAGLPVIIKPTERF